MQGSVFVEVVNGAVTSSGRVVSTANSSAWVLSFEGPRGSTRIIPIQYMLNLHFFATAEECDAWLEGAMAMRKDPIPPEQQPDFVPDPIPERERQEPTSAD